MALSFWQRNAGRAAVGVLLSCVGCGRRAPAAGNQAAPGASTAASNACDRKLLTPADVAGILTAPIIGAHGVPGDAQSCVFTTASFPSITVTLRPNVGKTTVDTWNAGRMPLAATALAGVGDEAAWVASLHEVIAEQSNLLCDIQVSGAGSDFTTALEPDQQRRIGGLCSRIFAAARPPAP